MTSVILKVMHINILWYSFHCACSCFVQALVIRRVWRWLLAHRRTSVCHSWSIQSCNWYTSIELLWDIVFTTAAVIEQQLLLASHFKPFLMQVWALAVWASHSWSSNWLLSQTQCLLLSSKHQSGTHTSLHNFKKYQRQQALGQGKGRYWLAWKTHQPRIYCFHTSIKSLKFSLYLKISRFAIPVHAIPVQSRYALDLSNQNDWAFSLIYRRKCRRQISWITICKSWSRCARNTLHLGGL